MEELPALPDDVVLQIFSLLGADMLLGAVPLVCKHWASLARHPDAWTNEEAYLPTISDDDSKVEKSLRVLRLAPHLNFIYTEYKFGPSSELIPIVDKCTTALLEGRLTSLKKLMTFPTECEHMRAQMSKILAKFKNSLREVQLYVGLPECSSNVVSVTTAKDFRRLVQRIASLPRMTSLGFHFKSFQPDRVDKEVDCFAPLSSGCPALRKVTVIGNSFPEEISWNAVLHAIRGKPLTELDLGLNAPHHPEVFAAVAECKSLTKFSSGVEYLPAIKDMTSLCRLTLYLPAPISPNVNDLLACPVLPSITELTIDLDGCHLNLGFCHFVKSLSEKCGNVVQLCIRSCWFDDSEMFESVLNCWPNLSCLTIINCGGMIPSFNYLCSVQGLKRVILKDFLSTDENKLIAAVRRLKQQGLRVCYNDVQYFDDCDPDKFPFFDYEYLNGEEKIYQMKIYMD